MKKNHGVSLNNKTSGSVPIPVLILWGLFMHLAGCSFFNSTPIPPLKVPIALHQAGIVLETDVEIEQDDRIYLRLEFLVNDQPMDRDRLLTFLGKGRDRIGTPIPLNVTITKYAVPKDEVLLEKTYTTTAPMIIGRDFFDRTIAELSIPSGRYRIRLKTLEVFPQLSDTPVLFRLGYIRAPK